jgi:hypothetical protein
MVKSYQMELGNIKKYAYIYLSIKANPKYAPTHYGTQHAERPGCKMLR